MKVVVIEVDEGAHTQTELGELSIARTGPFPNPGDGISIKDGSMTYGRYVERLMWYFNESGNIEKVEIIV